MRCDNLLHVSEGSDNLWLEFSPRNQFSKLFCSSPPPREKQLYGKENKSCKSRLRQRHLSSRKCTSLHSDQSSCSFITMMIHMGHTYAYAHRCNLRILIGGLQSYPLWFPSANHTSDMKRSAVASGHTSHWCFKSMGQKKPCHFCRHNFSCNLLLVRVQPLLWPTTQQR